MQRKSSLKRHSRNQSLHNVSKSAAHLWAPEIFAIKGGIQTYSALLLKSFQDLYPSVPHRVFLKNDFRNRVKDNGHSKTRFSCAGSWPKRLRKLYFALLTIGRGAMERPEIIISTHVNFAPLAYYLKRITGVPYWVAAHGVDVWGVTDPALKTALRAADLILSVSGYTRDRLLSEQRLDRDKVVILPNTVDSARFNIKPKPEYLMRRYKIALHHPVILTVSRLDGTEKYKGYDSVLRALPAIRQAIPEARYLIVGDGDDRPRIEMIAAELGLTDCVTLAGYVSDEELCDHYNLCDVFAMPSKGEGFGVVFLEAMACGKPTLAGNKDGSVDALRCGELGVLVDPDNVDAITSALTGILKATFPHPIIYSPHLLRQKVISAFGFDAFKSKLSNLVGARLTFDLDGADPSPGLVCLDDEK